MSTRDTIYARSLAWGKVAFTIVGDEVRHSSPLATKAENSKPWVVVVRDSTPEGREFVVLEAQQ